MQNLQGFSVNFKLKTCNAYIFFFHTIFTCVPKVRNYVDFKQYLQGLYCTYNPHDNYMHVKG